MAHVSKIISKTSAQNYPRIHDTGSQYFGCLDDSTLVQHERKLPAEQVKNFIRNAIIEANGKSSREILSIGPGETAQQAQKKFTSAGKKLLDYFRQYCIDPAATAHQTQGKHYTTVGQELFHRRTLQKERMNSGWRYQYLTVSCATNTGRFGNVSDIGTTEGDFTARIKFQNYAEPHLNLYVSVKNRKNTVGGQDYPKVARSLEAVATNDKNRNGPYLCVFGITMDRGTRSIRRDKGQQAHSQNTEIWLSDYFWPFFTNYSYEEIMTLVLEVLQEEFTGSENATQIEAPREVLEAFGAACASNGLLDDGGNFKDARDIVRFICAPQRKAKL